MNPAAFPLAEQTHVLLFSQYEDLSQFLTHISSSCGQEKYLELVRLCSRENDIYKIELSPVLLNAPLATSGAAGIQPDQQSTDNFFAYIKAYLASKALGQKALFIPRDEITQEMFSDLANLRNEQTLVYRFSFASLMATHSQVKFSDDTRVAITGYQGVLVINDQDEVDPCLGYYHLLLEDSTFNALCKNGSFFHVLANPLEKHEPVLIKLSPKKLDVRNFYLDWERPFFISGISLKTLCAINPNNTYDFRRLLLFMNFKREIYGEMLSQYEEETRQSKGKPENTHCCTLLSSLMSRVAGLETLSEIEIIISGLEQLSTSRHYWPGYLSSFKMDLQLLSIEEKRDSQIREIQENLKQQLAELLPSQNHFEAVRLEILANLNIAICKIHYEINGCIELPSEEDKKSIKTSCLLGLLQGLANSLNSLKESCVETKTVSDLLEVRNNYLQKFSELQEEYSANSRIGRFLNEFGKEFQKYFRDLEQEQVKNQTDQQTLETQQPTQESTSAAELQPAPAAEQQPAFAAAKGRPGSLGIFKKPNPEQLQQTSESDEVEVRVFEARIEYSYVFPTLSS